MKNTESAGGIIQNTRGEIAIVRNGLGAWWGFPKGHVDTGEDVLITAKREIKEETGLENILLVKNLGSYSRYKGSPEGGDDTSEYKTIHMFFFTTTEEVDLMPIDAGNPEARWVAIGDVEKMLTHPKDKKFWNTVAPQLFKVPQTSNALNGK